MTIVSFYNNKGGVGKSTLVVGMAEFLASNLKKRVLVIDLDAQASTASSLIDYHSLRKAVMNGRSIVSLAEQVRQNGRLPENLDDYFLVRSAVKTRGSALGELAVLCPNKAQMIELQEEMNDGNDLTLLRDHLKPELSDFDYVLVDLPGNADRHQRFVVNGVTMSDFVLVVTKPDRISASALPDTFEFIEYAQAVNREHPGAGSNGLPAVLGLLLNSTHRGSAAYRTVWPDIQAASERGKLPPVFTNFIGIYNHLSQAVDVTRSWRTLKSRFFGDALYNKIRKATRELVQRCEDYQPPRSHTRLDYSRVMTNLLETQASRAN